VIARAARGEAATNVCRLPTSKVASANGRFFDLLKKIPRNVQDQLAKGLESPQLRTAFGRYAVTGNISLPKGFLLSRLRSENNSTYPAGQRLVSRKQNEASEGIWQSRQSTSGCHPQTTRLIILSREAGVAKLVYAPDSKSGEVKLMSVRVRPPAPPFP
jgi:hypothetical protein